jgi:VanZ family protein
VDRFSTKLVKRAFYKALFFLLLRMVITTPARYTAAVMYFLFITVMFCLPGSVLPHEDWLSKIYFDKWVHIGFFVVLLLLWLWALMPERKGAVWLLVAAVLYGITIEVVQYYFIPNRSFDLTDWAADTIGSFIGLWFWRRYIKNRPL